MTAPLSDTRLTEIEQLRAQLGDWIAANVQAKDNAARALELLQRGDTGQAVSLLRRMAGGEHELPQRESLLAEVERLRIFGETEHAKRGVELENLRASWRDVRQMLIRGASASRVLDVMDRHDRAVVFAQADAARAAGSGAGQ